MIVTVTPTIQDGTVVRWYPNEFAVEMGREAISASRNGVLVNGYLHEASAEVMADAQTAYETLRHDRDADVSHLATHRGDLFGPLEEIVRTPETDAQLHARCAHPDWEYATTEGQRKAWDHPDEPPEGDDWEKNIGLGRVGTPNAGWDRFDYHEESYWRRRRKPTNEWRIDPQTLMLTGPGIGQRFTGAEFDAQRWPPCPVCGTTVAVDQLDVQATGDPLPVYIPGRWRCPNECDPRRST